MYRKVAKKGKAAQGVPMHKPKRKKAAARRAVLMYIILFRLFCKTPQGARRVRIVTRRKLLHFISILMHDAPPLESGGKRAQRRTLLKKKERQGLYTI